MSTGEGEGEHFLEITWRKNSNWTKFVLLFRPSPVSPKYIPTYTASYVPLKVVIDTLKFALATKWSTMFCLSATTNIKLSHLLILWLKVFGM